jgi:hypothetical protein
MFWSPAGSRIKNCTVHDSKSSASQKLEPRIPKILNAASCQKYLEIVVYYIFFFTFTYCYKKNLERKKDFKYFNLFIDLFSK